MYGGPVDYYIGNIVFRLTNEDANEAYKKIKHLFEDLKKFRKEERKQDHPLDYDQIPERY